jgi:hypothetical protein
VFNCCRTSHGWYRKSCNCIDNIAYGLILVISDNEMVTFAGI